MHTFLSWPPVYTVKRHPLARTLKLRITLDNGLQIIVPKKMKLSAIEPALEKHRDWIIKNLHQLKERENQLLPTDIVFPAWQKRWKIEYLASSNALRIFARPNDQLIIYGSTEDKKACRLLLLRWIRQQAKKYLIPLLYSLSNSINLPFNQVFIRQQKSRWGSCSTMKNINLNDKLVFLPLHLVRHVLIHELCHTVEMNHSEKFWRLVAMHDLSWQENRRALQSANSHLPTWFE